MFGQLLGQKQICALISLNILIVQIMHFYFFVVDKNIYKQNIEVYLIVIMNAYFSCNRRIVVLFSFFGQTLFYLFLKIQNTDFWRNICLINRLYMFFYLISSYFLRYGSLDFSNYPRRHYLKMADFS